MQLSHTTAFGAYIRHGQEAKGIQMNGCARLEKISPVVDVTSNPSLAISDHSTQQAYFAELRPCDFMGSLLVPRQRLILKHCFTTCAIVRFF